MWKPLVIGVGARTVPKKQLGTWLRTTLDGSGPTYVKIGQFISNRPDIFGRELSNDLSPLRDRVTEFDFGLVKDLVPSVITEVDPKPIASASIAQVHRARYKGKDVVVKFKRPGIEAIIKEDLQLIRRGSELLNMIPNFNAQFMVPWLNEFERGLLSEIDFKQEIRNIALFRDMYRDRTDVKIPRPYSKLSTDSFIVMDYVPSRSMKPPADRLINMFLEQLLYEGVVHGDLHTGNLGQDDSGSIVLYDFGNIIRISDSYKVAIRDFVYGVQTSNVDAVIDNMVRMGMTVRDREMTKTFVGQYFDYLNTLDVNSFSVSSPELQKRAENVPVELDSTTLTIIRTYSLLEGLCKDLDPTFSYQSIISKNIEMLFLDLDYIIYRISKDTSSL
ncbi:AarF/ABC1/UbiB kinase family protein [bacterium]|nr:AarF/ABC1/UbiB kinase family protein [bacterium]NBX48622.1 AarF/ABC1/UbiB kinase family protein [bacterium]